MDSTSVLEGKEMEKYNCREKKKKGSVVFIAILLLS